MVARDRSEGVALVWKHNPNLFLCALYIDSHIPVVVVGLTRVTGFFLIFFT